MTGKTRYPGYNGLGRTPGVWGVPYMAALVVFALSVTTALFCAAFLGPGGLLFIFLGVPVLIFFKQICETDDQGLRILWLELGCRFYWWRLKAGAFLKAGRAQVGFGGTTTLGPLRYGRQVRVYRDFFRRQRDDATSRTSRVP